MELEDTTILMMLLIVPFIAFRINILHALAPGVLKYTIPSFGALILVPCYQRRQSQAFQTLDLRK